MTDSAAPRLGLGIATLFALRLLHRRPSEQRSDALLRLGGEEFGVLMPNILLEQACQLAESSRQKLVKQSFDIDDNYLPLTACLGGFEPQRDHDAAAFFKRVDDALYLAKGMGHNQLA